MSNSDDQPIGDSQDGAESTQEGEASVDQPSLGDDNSAGRVPSVVEWSPLDELLAEVVPVSDDGAVVDEVSAGVPPVDDVSGLEDLLLPAEETSDVSEPPIPWPSPEDLIDESELAASLPDVHPPAPPPVTDHRPPSNTASVSAWLEDVPASDAAAPPGTIEKAISDVPPPERLASSDDNPPPPPRVSDPLDHPPPPIRALDGTDSSDTDSSTSTLAEAIEAPRPEPAAVEGIPGNAGSADHDLVDGQPENAPFNPAETVFNTPAAPEVEDIDPLAELLASPPPELLADMLGAPSPSGVSFPDSIDAPPPELLAEMFDAPSSEEAPFADTLPSLDVDVDVDADRSDHPEREPTNPTAVGPEAVGDWDEMTSPDPASAYVGEIAPDTSIPFDPPPPVADPWIQPSDQMPPPPKVPLAPSSDHMPLEPDVWSPIDAPPGESPSQPHAQQWQDATPWGAPPPAADQEPTTYSWYVPARRDTEYDGPFYTKTGEILDAPVIPDEDAAAGKRLNKAKPKDKKTAPPGRAEPAAPSVEKGSSKRLVGRVLLIGALLALAGGAVFAIRQAFASQAGPASPDIAAQQMVAALENQDALGIYELWLPSERESVSGDVVHLLTELDRLEGGDNEFTSLVAPEEESGLPAATTLEVNDVTYDIESVGETVSYLTTTGGTVISQADSGAVAELGDELGAEPTTEGLSFEVDLGADPISVAVVEENGGWYFSLYYTLAEAARRDGNKPNPTFEGSRLAVGADEPKEAIVELMLSLSEFDLIGVVNRLDPVEFRALYDYREFVDPSIEELAAELQSDEGGEVSWELTKVITSSNDIRGRDTIGIELMEVTVGDGDGDGDGDPVEFVITDRCLSSKGFEGQTLFDSCDPNSDEEVAWVNDLPDWLTADREQLNIRVVERDSRWYVSGLPTVLGNITDQLAAMTPADWEADKDDVADLFESLPSEVVDALEAGGWTRG